MIWKILLLVFLLLNIALIAFGQENKEPPIKHYKNTDTIALPGGIKLKVNADNPSAFDKASGKERRLVVTLEIDMGVKRHLIRQTLFTFQFDPSPEKSGVNLLIGEQRFTPKACRSQFQHYDKPIDGMDPVTTLPINDHKYGLTFPKDVEKAYLHWLFIVPEEQFKGNKEIKLKFNLTEIRSDIPPNPEDFSFIVSLEK